MTALLEVRGLTTRFHTSEGVVHAVSDVSFEVRQGETLAIVGESGSGKSVTMLSILRLLPEPPARIEAGEVRFRGQDLLALDRGAMRRLRGSAIGMVFQDPMSSLNPTMTIGEQVAETLRVHEGLEARAARQRSVELLRMVGIPAPESRVNEYPHRFSGGMRQRAMIAMALAARPSLLIADEPTTALDVTVQAQLLRLVKRLRAELGMSVVWITHDLGVVARLAERVVVMYAGRVVEEASVRTFYRRPCHPYSRGLLESLPRPGIAEALVPIGGQPPDLLRLGKGCAFAPRCTMALARCTQEAPPLAASGDDPRDRVACWRAGEPEATRDAA